MNTQMRAVVCRWMIRWSFAIWIIAANVAAGIAQSRLPVPSIEKQQEIVKLLQETYDLGRSDSAAKKHATLKTLKESNENDSLGGDERYVVLTTILSLARDTGDGAEYVETVKSLTETYLVNELQVKSRLLIEFLASSKSGVQLKPVIEETASVARTAAFENHYDDANTLLSAADAAIRRVPGTAGLKPLLVEMRRGVAAREKDWKSFQSAAAKLKADAEDPAANLTTGRWHAVYLADWDVAIPYLAKGSDARWKAAAILEQADPTDGMLQSNIGDAWWDVAQKEVGDSRTAVLLHTKDWYEKCQSQLQSALKKQLISKRLDEIGELQPLAIKSDSQQDQPSVGSLTKPGEWVDLLAWTDGVEWKARGIDWDQNLETKGPSGITLKSQYCNRYPLPAIIDGDYELDVEFTRHSGSDAVGVNFPVGIHCLQLGIGSNGGKLGGVAMIDGKWYFENSTSRRPSPVTNAEKHRILLRVTNDGTRATFNVEFDGIRDYVKWEGLSSSLTFIEADQPVSLTRHLWLLSQMGQVTFHTVRIRMSSGTVYRDAITEADREQDLKRGIVRLVGEKPTAASVGSFKFLVNQLPLDLSPGETEYRWPLVTADFKPCPDYYGVHAPSRLICPIPRGAKSFSVIGFNEASRTSIYVVIVDGKEIYRSGKTAIETIKLDLPARASTLELVMDPAGSSQYDHSYWCFPRYHTMSADKIADKMLDSKPGPLRFAVASGTVGTGTVSQNKPINELSSAPTHFRDAVPCDEFLYAHAPSMVTYTVPPGMTRFTAVAYNVVTHRAGFQVWADGKQLYEKSAAGIFPIDVRLPAGTDSIELKVVDSQVNTAADHSMWCYPRLHRK
ncbi:MAG: NPCBM/NEW2 domain-containing protein [Planctomycetes bacterium]|nr:NPCBM/NEW2 domain-containing protein [Planctomycetota bacterium]